jgi:hypothetical protein
MCSVSCGALSAELMILAHDPEKVQLLIRTENSNSEISFILVCS